MFMPLLASSSDVIGLICRILGMRDLAALSIAMKLPDWVWTVPVRRRCGERWPAGAAGMRRLYRAVYGAVPLPVSAVRAVHKLRGSAMAYYAAGTRGVNIWASANRPRGHVALDRSVTCLAAIDEDRVALGHGYGVYVYEAHLMTPVWLGVAVCDVAYVSGNRLWICTVQHSTYEYCTLTDTLTALRCPWHSFCVSGPIAVLGSSRGTWPLTGSVDMPCTRIVQSDVQIAAWYVSGHILVFDASTQLQVYLMDTGVRSPQRSLSIIGDIIRINGKTWSSGRCTGCCPDDNRSITSDARYLYVSQYGRVGISVYA